MKVKRLTMRSFRGIDDLTLDFDPNITVLIGNNGVGKSSVLNSLSTLLADLTGRLRTSTGSEIMEGDSRQFFSESDIKDGAQESSVSVQASFLSLADVEIERTTEQKALDLENISWSLTKFQKNQGKGSLRDSGQLHLIVDRLHEQFFSSNPNLFLLVFYPVNRTVPDIPLKALSTEQSHAFQQLQAYDQSLINSRLDFALFFTWFKQQEDLENELRLNDNPDHRDRYLEAIRKAIPELLPGFSNLRVRRSPLRMTVQKQGQELIINQLSDGEKCLLAMVGDLARRLAIANPGLPNPLQGEGVVLIDEIELHLHPKWQRAIVPALTRTFPNCQFIVTTHSPQVLGEVKGKVYRLKLTSDGIIAESLQTYGRDSSEILEDEMEADSRSVEIKQDLRQLFRLIEDGDLDAARELKKKMSDEIGDDESEFVKAEILIRRYEVLGR